MTSPYKFYQYWLNCADADAPKLLRLFTLLPAERIAELEAEQAPPRMNARCRRRLRGT